MGAWLAACAMLACLGISARAAEVAPGLPATEARTALVIGNADYPNSPLANPVNDARAIAQRLTAQHFRVTRLENATQEQMYEAIRAFGDALRAGGVGLFYYAGHALQVRGRNYLLPARARIEREDEIIYRTVDTGQILDKMESARNRVNVMILDACRNNPFGRDFRSVSPGLAVVDAPTNTLIAFATAPGAVASDGAGPNGLYTQHLMQAMATPGLRLEDVFKKVRTGVRQDSAGRQVPWESTSLEVDFYFDPASAGPSAASPAPDPLMLELAFWDSVKGSSDPEDHRAYLKRYPEGQFAVLAGNRLRALTRVAAAPLATPVAAPVMAPSAVPAASAGAAEALTGGSPPLPGRVLRGHSEGVLTVALSRSGNAALTGAADRSLRLWDLSSGTEMRQFAGHGAAVTASAFAADPRHVLSGSADRSVRLWDVASGAEQARMDGHAATVTAVTFDPTGRYAVSAAEDGELVLWELPSGRLLRRARADARGVRSVALSPDGRFLLSTSSDGTVRLWDFASLQVVRSYGAMTAPAECAAFSADGRRVSAVDRQGQVWSWQTQGGAETGRFATGGKAPMRAAIASDGAAVLIAEADGRLTLWDIGSGRTLWRSRATQARVTAVALGPLGSIGLWAADDDRLWLWNSRRSQGNTP